MLPQRRRSTCCGQARITRQPGSKEGGDKQYKGTQVLQCGCQATRGKNKTVPSGPSRLHSCQKTAISRAFSAPRSNLRVSPQASRDQDSSLFTVQSIVSWAPLGSRGPPERDASQKTACKIPRALALVPGCHGFPLVQLLFRLHPWQRPSCLTQPSPQRPTGLAAEPLIHGSLEPQGLYLSRQLHLAWDRSHSSPLKMR